jgi:hypothetical protein
MPIRGHFKLTSTLTLEIKKLSCGHHVIIQQLNSLTHGASGKVGAAVSLSLSCPARAMTCPQKGTRKMTTWEGFCQAEQKLSLD